MKDSISLLVFTILVFYIVGRDSADIVLCVTNEDCKKDKVCTNQECVDPCTGACPPNTVCYVDNHVAVCSCSPGKSGHPIVGCSSSPDASGHLGCSGHDQCPASKACIQGKCDNPCESLCGDNTSCTVLNHVPACSCKEGYTGNPFFGCALQGQQATQPQARPLLNQGKKKFFVETEKKVDWHEAFMFCLRNQSRLASVESLEELEEIKELIRKSGKRLGNFWTSGSDYGYEGDYVWASTGKHFSAISDLWLQNPQQPDNWQGKEHCVEVWERFLEQGYGLNDSVCQQKNHFICEYHE